MPPGQGAPSSVTHQVVQTKNQAAPLPPTLLARHWLEGEWLNSDQGVARHSPTRRQDTVTWVPVAEPSLVSRALASAGGAARAWGTTPVRVRAAWLSALAESLRARGDALAGVMCREQGTCRRRAEEDIRAASLLLGMLRHRLETSRGELLSGGASEREVLTRRRPRGTIGLVTDAIEPVSSMASTVATALGCANTVLWMPPLPSWWVRSGIRSSSAAAMSSFLHLQSAALRRSPLSCMILK